jgi:hypothetical protein
MRDGASITALEEKITLSKNTIMAIETLEGDVFGCFMSNKWEKTGRYELDSASFLWRMKHKRTAPILSGNDSEDQDMIGTIAQVEGEVEVYRWTGQNEDCQLFSDERLAVGGGGEGFGFVVEDGLWRGTSSPCSTYDNPILVSSPNGKFEIATMEGWCMTPFLFVEDAEKSEARLRFIRENTVPNSLTSSWARYM